MQRNTGNDRFFAFVLKIKNLRFLSDTGGPVEITEKQGFLDWHVKCSMKCRQEKRSV